MKDKMLRSLAILVVLIVLVPQVALTELRYEDELKQDFELLEHILAKENEDEKSLKRVLQAQVLSIKGKDTKQSSTMGGYVSDKAADEIYATYLYPGNKCTHTEEESHPWWRVDLGGIHCISSVDILNRGDCCSERLENAVVRAGASSTPTDNPTCGSPVTAAQAAPRGGTISFECDQPLRARYVSVDIPYSDKGYLQLCEVTVKETSLDYCPAPQELSIVGRPTVQSSTYLEAYSSDKAVDGSSSASLYPGKKCSHTGEESHPWWRVDLGGIHCISSVAILNRGDCCSERLENAVVRAGTSSTPTYNWSCGSPVTAAQAAPRGGTISFECDQPLRARYVSVDIPYTNKGFLQLCEVTVKELPLDQCLTPTPLVIEGKNAEQSSTLEPYSADKAVDGSSSTSLYPGKKCSHTESGAENPWWRVDLGGEHCISGVTILNRGDCSSERLENAVVRAGPSATATNNEPCGSPVTAAQARPRGGTINFECDHPLRARYISVDIPGSATLQLCEVTVRELPLDLCPAPQGFSIVNKPTEQSSTLEPYSADKAVDGSSSASLYPGKKCSHTESGSLNPWWRVNLGGEHCISKVTILNRGDCCSERLENAVVRAGLSATATDNPACGSPVTAAQAAPRGGTIEFYCHPALRARYVSVDIPGSATLQLCEVTVEELVPGLC